MRAGDDGTGFAGPPDEADDAGGAGKIRLQRFLALAGLGARRKMEEVITAGRVTVNGAVARLGGRVDPEHDSVKLDGKRVRLPDDHLYLAMHKPPHTLSSRHDDRERPLVMALIPEKFRRRVHPIGRLDFESEGLLLFTSDGELTLKLTHPRYKLFKTYRVKVKGAPAESDLDKIRRGMVLEGRRTLPMVVAPMRGNFGPKPTASNRWLEVKMVEGRKNQIRELFFRVGHPVIRLIRVAVGPVELGSLPPGAVRPLAPEEVRALKSAKPAELPAPPPRRRPVSGVRAAQEKFAERESGRVSGRPSSNEHRSPRNRPPRDDRRPPRAPNPESRIPNSESRNAKRPPRDDRRRAPDSGPRSPAPQRGGYSPRPRGNSRRPR